MKVLFVCSVNKGRGISPFIKSQGNSLSREAVNLDYYLIKGKGIIGYLKNIQPLRKKIKEFSPNIIHAHYSFSGILASFSTRKPIIVSLLGSDVHGGLILKVLIKIFLHFSWRFVIVKTQRMKEVLMTKTIEVIPNGVNLDQFKTIPRSEAIKIVGFNDSFKNVVFLADPNRHEKNYPLAKKSVELLNNEKVKLHVVHGISHEIVPAYLYSSDCLLLTSKWEGSPNVVKEAMACGCPVVSTYVGDVEWLFGKEEGYYIAEQNPEDIASKLAVAINFECPTNGLNRIIELGIDSKSIALRLITIYKQILKH